MQIKRKDIWETFVALKNLPECKSPKVAYAFAKNYRKILPFIEAIEIADKPTKEFSEFTEKRIAACKKYCIRDENMQPVTTNNEVDILPEKRDEFDSEIEKLKEKYKESIEENDKKKEEVKALLESCEEVEYHKVSLDDVDKAFEKILPTTMVGIFDMIGE